MSVVSRVRNLVIGILSLTIFGAAVMATEKGLPVPAGSTLRVRLETTLTDKTNQTGDPFTGVVTTPIISDGQEVIPQYSMVYGHVAFVKPSGRIYGKAQMRIVIDKVTTPDDVNYPLSATLEDAAGGVCSGTTPSGKGKADEEGTITGCGKSKKKALEAAAIAGGMGAAGGLTVGLAGRGGCDYYGRCYPGTGSNIGADVGYGAGIGAGTALVYSLLKHEKHIVLVQGTVLTFTVNRNVVADPASIDQQPSQ